MAKNSELDIKWTIPKIKVLDKHGKYGNLEVEENYQIDEVGNIYQISGGVIPKACQRCKQLFNAPTKETPVIQKVGIYKCEDCEFENAGADITLDHKIQTNHKIRKIQQDKFVGTERKIIGLKAQVTVTKDNCIILCDDCYAD